MEARVLGRVIALEQGDVTRQATDAIVNAANAHLAGGGGVDGAIHRAGGPSIMAECRRIGGCPTGQAVITGGGKLAARHVIHAVGPVWEGGSEGEPDLLASAYRRSLEVARDHRLRTVAFPSISTGAYGYPVRDAARTALWAVRNHLAGETTVERVVFVLFDRATFDAYAEALREAGPLTPA